jgi:hypothetical protein
MRSLLRFRCSAFVLFALTLAAGCDDGPTVGDPPDTGTDGGACADGGGTDGGCDEGFETIGPLTVNTEVKDHAIDLFGPLGHRIWVEVSAEQLFAINQGGGGVIFQEGDIYTPGGDGPGATYADHVVVEDVATGEIADFGKVELRIVGESTRRPFDRSSIPNLRFDFDEFEPGQRVGGFEHIRLNNGLVGSIFREALAHRIYRSLGYPALRSSWAFLGSNVWGNDVWVPMVLMEVYKRKLCTDSADLIGGGCVNMWEFPGEAGGGDPGEQACQLSECDNTRLVELAEALDGAPDGTGFKAALDPFIDWERFHQFQCMSWIMWTGDDPFHNGNNNLIIEREDGRLVWAPYSIDISMGQDWYVNTPLPGSSRISSACQRDSECWADTIASCESLIDAFAGLEPEKLVDELRETLDDAGMLRDGDDERADLLREWTVTRVASLPDELERYRYLPGPDGCPNSLEICNDGTCGTSEECANRLCGGNTTWCESVQACLYPGDVCPSCDEEGAPFFCSANSECVADVPACDLLCAELNGDGWFYCPEWRGCSGPDGCQVFPGPK